MATETISKTIGRCKFLSQSLTPLEPGDQCLDLSRVSLIGIQVILHRRWRRFYAGRRSEARAIGAFLRLSRFFAVGRPLHYLLPELTKVETEAILRHALD